MEDFIVDNYVDWDQIEDNNSSLQPLPQNTLPKVLFSLFLFFFFFFPFSFFFFSFSFSFFHSFPPFYLCNPILGRCISEPCWYYSPKSSWRNEKNNLWKNSRTRTTPWRFSTIKLPSIFPFFWGIVYFIESICSLSFFEKKNHSRNHNRNNSLKVSLSLTIFDLWTFFFFFFSEQ